MQQSSSDRRGTIAAPRHAYVHSSRQAFALSQNCSGREPAVTAHGQRRLSRKGPESGPSRRRRRPRVRPGNLRCELHGREIPPSPRAPCTELYPKELSHIFEEAAPFLVPIHVRTHTHTHTAHPTSLVYITQCTYPIAYATHSYTHGILGWLGGGALGDPI